MLSSNQTHLRNILQRLLRRNATSRIQNMLERTHIADIAEVLRFLGGRERMRVFELLPDRDHQAELLSELDDSIIEELCDESADDHLVDLLQRMNADDAADVIGLLDEARGARLLEAMTHEDDVEGLLRYDEETAGGIMMPLFFSLTEDATAAEAIRELQTAADVEMVFYIYVVNEHGQLVGVVSLRQLVTTAATTRLGDIMETDVYSVRVDMDREDVARLVARYNILAVPVVDEANKLLGIVTVDDVIDVIREEATEDFLKMAGAGDEDLLEDPSVARAAWVRMPWLLASFAGGVMAAAIIGAFEVALSQVAALAAFIPVIMGMGGNVGTQSSTLIVRGIATGRVDVNAFARTLGHEVAVGVLLGLAYGVLLAGVAYVLYGDGTVSVFGLAASVGLAIGAAMTVATMVGGGLPLVFERLSIDPAVATGPFVTTAVDVFGILIYFGIAYMLVPELAAAAGG